MNITGKTLHLLQKREEKTKYIFPLIRSNVWNTKKTIDRVTSLEQKEKTTEKIQSEVRHKKVGNIIKVQKNTKKKKRRTKRKYEELKMHWRIKKKFRKVSKIKKESANLSCYPPLTNPSNSILFLFLPPLSY